MSRNHKLQRTYVLNVIIINLLSITFLGSIWVLHEYWQYKDEIKVLKDDFIDNQKTNIKNEVENAISYVDNINKDTEKDLKNTLQTRLYEVFQIVNSVYKSHNGHFRHQVQEEIKDLLRKLNSGNQDSYIYIVANNTIGDLNPNLNITNDKNLLFPADVYTRQKIVEKSKAAQAKGDGFFRHKWITSDNKKYHEQVSYVKYFEPFGWIIGTAINYEEFVSSRQQDVILRLSHIRFGKKRDGYLFVNCQNADPLCTNGIITIGQPNNWNLEDPYGIKILQEEHKAAQKPEGDYIYYSWRKIFTLEEKAYGIEKPTSPKVSFVKGYSPWNWMVGAGFYLDDIDIVIAQKRATLFKVICNHTFVISLSLVVSILVTLVLVKLMQNRIDFNFKRFINFFSEASSGKAKLDFESLYFEEFKDLAEYANQMVEQRELAEHVFRQIVEVFPFPICLFKNNIIFYLNPQWTKIIGYNVDEIPSVSRTLIKCFPDVEERYLLQHLKIGDTINTLDQKNRLFKVSCKDGQIRHMKLNYIEMKNNRSMITLEDYSYRKKVEDEINAARIKAEQSDKLKSAFLANMSHEIRTPMNAIIGFSGLLQNNILSEEKRNTYLSYILKSSESLLNLINDILDISKIEAGELNIHIVSENLESTFSTIDAEIKSIRSTMNKNDIEIISLYNFKGEVGIFETDFLRLKQILLNLLGNALKFTKRGTIEYGCILLNSQTLQFFVKDSGIGIMPNHLQHIFNRFTKIEEDNSHVFRGAGLGLAISKKLVEALGGTIWVESQYGQGSTFYFTLPYKHRKPIEKKLDSRIY